MTHLRITGQVSRHQARAVVCPECGAKEGERCVGKRGLRESNHLGRVHRARMFLRV